MPGARAPAGEKKRSAVGLPIAELMVFSRPGCHLCELLLEELEPLSRRAGVTVRVIDVDTRPDWRERFGTRVPVVCAGDEELSGWPFDRAGVSARLGLL
jgi:hypothetical protein